MKNNIILVLVVALSGYQAASADILDAATSGIIFKEAAVYPKDTKIAVEVKNKDTNSIWVVVKDGKHLYRLEELPGATGILITRKNPTKQWDVNNLDEPTLIGVWLKKPAGQVTPTKEGILGLTGQETFEPRPDRLYTFTKGKTMYLTWDEKKELRPQTGPASGKLNVTDTGLSLAKNVKPEDIQKITVGTTAQMKG